MPVAHRSPVRSVGRSDGPTPVPALLVAILALGTLGTTVLPASLAAQEPGEREPTEAELEAGTHLNHIMSAWEDAPEGQGLLALAVAETQIAARHATLAVRSSDNLEAMKTHARHVLHSLDPTRVEGGGPGLGYGIVRVSEDIADHIQLALEAEGYGGNIANHAPAVVQSADNAARWGREMMEVAEAIQAAETASEAEPLAVQLRHLSTRVVSGADLNDDDEIRWQDGEGGIMHVQQHMSLLMRVDGRWYLDRRDAPDSEDPDGGNQ